MTDTPNKDDTAIRRKIRLVTKHANELSRMTPSDAALADAVGLTRAIEVSLSKTRRRWESLVAEMEPIREPSPKVERVDPGARSGRPVVQGTRYELVPKYKTVRSYNTPAILTSIAAATGGSPTDALMNAIGAGAARLTWAWTPLKRYLKDVDAAMTVVAHEVADHSGLDEGMVGEVEVQAGVDRVPIKEATG